MSESEAGTSDFQVTRIAAIEALTEQFDSAFGEYRAAVEQLRAPIDTGAEGIDVMRVRDEYQRLGEEARRANERMLAAALALAALLEAL